MELMRTPWYYVHGPDFWFTFPRMERGRHIRGLDLTVAPLPFHTVVGKVLLGRSSPLFLSGCGSFAQLLYRWVSPDYRRRTCHWRRLLFRKSETIASAGVCLTEVPWRLRARDILG